MRKLARGSSCSQWSRVDLYLVLSEGSKEANGTRVESPRPGRGLNIDSGEWFSVLVAMVETSFYSLCNGSVFEPVWKSLREAGNNQPAMLRTHFRETAGGGLEEASAAVN